MALEMEARIEEIMRPKGQRFDGRIVVGLRPEDSSIGPQGFWTRSAAAARSDSAMASMSWRRLVTIPKSSISVTSS